MKFTNVNSWCVRNPKSITALKLSIGHEEELLRKNTTFH